MDKLKFTRIVPAMTPAESEQLEADVYEQIDAFIEMLPRVGVRVEHAHASVFREHLKLLCDGVVALRDGNTGTIFLSPARANDDATLHWDNSPRCQSCGGNTTGALKPDHPLYAHFKHLCKGCEEVLGKE